MEASFRVGEERRGEYYTRIMRRTNIEVLHGFLGTFLPRLLLAECFSVEQSINNDDDDDLSTMYFQITHNEPLNQHKQYTWIYSLESLGCWRYWSSFSSTKRPMFFLAKFFPVFWLRDTSPYLADNLRRGRRWQGSEHDAEGLCNTHWHDTNKSSLSKTCVGSGGDRKKRQATAQILTLYSYWFVL